MGTPRIYWYPDPAGSLETLDFGEGLSDLQELPGALVEDAYTGDGYPFRSFLQGNFRIRIILERFGSPGTSSLERKFSSLQAHLDRGGFIGFSRDHAKTWASLAAPGPVRGDTTVYTGTGNGFTAWSSSGTPAEGDELVIESGAPEFQREIAVCAALTVTPAVHLPLSAGCIYTYNQGVIARWRDFYPVLFRPKDQVGRPIVTPDHRRNWTLDLTLEYPLAAVLSLWSGEEWAYARSNSLQLPAGSGPIPFRDDSAVSPNLGSSLEELLQRAPTAASWRR